MQARWHSKVCLAQADKERKKKKKKKKNTCYAGCYTDRSNERRHTVMQPDRQNVRKRLGFSILNCARKKIIK